jgi:hypothetical protein
MISRSFDWRSAGQMALCVGWTALLLAGCTEAPKQQAEVPPPAAATPKPAEPVFTPVVSINALMVGMIDNAGHVLWDVEKAGLAPKNAAEWLEVEDHATQLAAAGSLIQMGGTGPADAGWVRQVGWNTSAHAMSTAALAAMSAAKSKNMDAGQSQWPARGIVRSVSQTIQARASDRRSRPSTSALRSDQEQPLSIRRLHCRSTPSQA